ncbi:hypothetical protein [Cardiobacterium hominis]|uniref:hypothetical protein n=1 Tax=Cardiobacterium hominis TaxID=2718 RepID=UPI0028D4548B|nr:hypothetical protein [Cardiobacterium hominis]
MVRRGSGQQEKEDGKDAEQDERQPDEAVGAAQDARQRGGVLAACVNGLPVDGAARAIDVGGAVGIFIIKG